MATKYIYSQLCCSVDDDYKVYVRPFLEYITHYSIHLLFCSIYIYIYIKRVYIVISKDRDNEYKVPFLEYITQGFAARCSELNSDCFV